MRKFYLLRVLLFVVVMVLPGVSKSEVVPTFLPAYDVALDMNEESNQKDSHPTFYIQFDVAVQHPSTKLTIIFSQSNNFTLERVKWIDKYTAVYTLDEEQAQLINDALHRERAPITIILSDKEKRRVIWRGVTFDVNVADSKQ